MVQSFVNTKKFNTPPLLLEYSHDRDVTVRKKILAHNEGKSQTVLSYHQNPTLTSRTYVWNRSQKFRSAPLHKYSLSATFSISKSALQLYHSLCHRPRYRTLFLSVYLCLFYRSFSQWSRWSPVLCFLQTNNVCLFRTVMYSVLHSVALLKVMVFSEPDWLYYSQH